MATDSKIPIVVDDREERSGVLEVLECREDVDVTVQRLSVGDYVVDDKLLVERKTLMDFAGSIKDGRLFAQASRLALAEQCAVIFLEGTARDLAASKMRREALQGALISLTVYFGIPLLRSVDIEESVRLMLYAAGQGRTWENGALHRRGRRPKGKRRLQLYILQGLPGVGPQRARQLLERFGTVEAVLAASREELQDIEGIGAATAAGIEWSVREESPSYADPAPCVWASHAGSAQTS